mmetsp:Transcript_356/g.1195  ORF Transcript_356/g.1195 Transcript_356/m.1195 type:complete len:108 (+) Transcript_356:371-694(+)
MLSQNPSTVMSTRIARSQDSGIVALVKVLQAFISPELGFVQTLESFLFRSVHGFEISIGIVVKSAEVTQTVGNNNWQQLRKRSLVALCAPIYKWYAHNDIAQISFYL